MAYSAELRAGVNLCPLLAEYPSTILTRVNHGQPVDSSGNSQTLQNECTNRNNSCRSGGYYTYAQEVLAVQRLAGQNKTR
jgi:hypothetical protein